MVCFRYYLNNESTASHYPGDLLFLYQPSPLALPHKFIYTLQNNKIQIYTWS